MDVSIQLLSECDLDAGAKILESAFQRPGNWLGDLKFIHGLQPDGYFGAYLDGVLAGMVGSIVYPDFAYVGMMGVHQNFQRRGLGLVLMQHLLSWLEVRQVPIILLDASKAGRPLYEKIGFKPNGNVLNFQRQVGHPALQLPVEVQPLTDQDLSLILPLDTYAFGTGRSKVLLPLLQKYPGRAFFLKDREGNTSGYVIAQGRRIGPWVARDLAGAETLLKSALSLPFDNTTSIYLPDTNKGAEDLLRNYGFELARTNCHMARGEDGPLDHRRYVYGQVSLSLG